LENTNPAVQNWDYLRVSAELCTGQTKIKLSIQAAWYGNAGSLDAIA
jgi:hypothetical protein